VVLRPEVLVLDEPTSALDVSVQQQVLALLADLQRRYGMSYIFISHDLAVVRAMSHRVMVMKNGDVVEAGESEALFAAPQQAYTRNCWRRRTWLEPRRNINGHLRQAQSLVTPPGQQPDGLPDHPFADRQYQAGVFRHRNEHIRGNPLAPRRCTI
jgi:ABC-type dipeptide/oligopeptide/nickel transport system ATPase component